MILPARQALQGSRLEHAQYHRDLPGMVNRVFHDSVKHSFVRIVTPRNLFRQILDGKIPNLLFEELDFGSIWRRVRSRESAARPSPSRAAKAAANYCRRYCEFFHSKGANAEAAPKLNEILEWVASLQAQAKSALTTQRAKVRTKRL